MRRAVQLPSHPFLLCNSSPAGSPVAFSHRPACSVWVAFGLLSIYPTVAMSAPGGYLIAEILGGFALAVAVALYILALACSFLAHLRFNRAWWGSASSRLAGLAVHRACVSARDLLPGLHSCGILVFPWGDAGAGRHQACRPLPLSVPSRLGWSDQDDESRPNLLLVRGVGFINETGFIYPRGKGTDYYEQGVLRAWYPPGLVSAELWF